MGGTMKLHCGNKSKVLHVHETLEEAAKCWGTPALYVVGGDLPKPGVPVAATGERTDPPPVWTVGAPPSPKPRWHDEPVTASQLWRVEKEGGSRKKAATLTKGQCSEYIDALKNGRCRKEPDDPDTEAVLTPPPSPPSPPPAPTPATSSSITRRPIVHGHWVAKAETVVMVPLLERVPDGRFAVSMSGEPLTFLRVSRPKSGKWAGCLKVQTQHAERYEEAWCKWEDGQVGVFKPSVEDLINVLISDWRGAARQFSKSRNRCARCGTELTDERSRHYGIGPECEKYWPEIITMVDEEEALRRGAK
jgi:hypothetical protein